MWTAKISFDGSRGLLGSKCLKYHVNLSGFSLSYFYEKNYITVNVTGILIGEEKNKKDLIRDLKKSKRFVEIEVNGDFFIAAIKEPISAKPFYNKKVIHLSPILIHEDGKEIMNIGCFNKKDLIKAVASLEKLFRISIDYIKERKIKNISIIKENPELTDKQKRAMNLAIKNKYYDYPKKIELKKLAKIMGISYSTYQEHLKKAEKKLMPFFFETD